MTLTNHKIITWIEKYITHVKGELAGKPLRLEKWQKKILNDVFGIMRGSVRQYRTVYIEVPRKNAKSTLGAAIGLYMLGADGEQGAEIYSAAGDRFQAGIIFDIAKQMVLQNPELSKRYQCWQNSITYHKKNNRYKAISADAKTKHGFNSHCILFDELHTQPNRELVDVLATSTGARLQPITFYFTTAGFDKTSICWEIHEYARKVIEGSIVDDTFYGVIFKAEEDADIYSESTWRKANPGYGTIVKKEYIEEQVNKVKNNPSFENTFRRLHLNQWTTSEIRWIQDEVWMECAGELPDVTGLDCWAGLDLASTRDISAFVLLFPVDEMFVTIPFFFVPDIMAKERNQRDGVDYINWIRQGYIIETPGNVTDYNFIRAKINELAEIYNIRGIAYDRWNASQLVNDLVDDGAKMDPFGQGFASMSAPTKELEKLVYGKQLVHGGNPVLRWMCSNVMIRQDPAGNIKIDKEKSTEKVDGMVGLVMALGEYMTDDSPGTSVYEERGILEL